MVGVMAMFMVMVLVMTTVLVMALVMAIIIVMVPVVAITLAILMVMALVLVRTMDMALAMTLVMAVAVAMAMAMAMIMFVIAVAIAVFMFISMARAMVVGGGFGYGSGYGHDTSGGEGKSDRLWAVEIEHNTDKLINWYLTEENAEVRARIINKVGLEPLIERLNAERIDSKTLEVGGKYELWQCQVFGETRKFIKMINPSTGIYHAEWVPPEINDVIDALKWRNNGYLPDKIT